MSAIKPSDIPSNPFERASWINHQLRLRRTSTAAIGRSLGVTRQAVSQAMYQPRARTELALAKAIGVPVAMLFPERFDPAGERRHKTQSRHKDTARAGHGKVENRGAAGQSRGASRALRG